MADKTKVKFLKDWRFAHGGYAIVDYKVDQECDLSDEALDAAVEDGVIELSEGKKKAKSTEKPAADVVNSSEKDKKKVEK